MHIVDMWAIDATDEYLDWFQDQEPAVREAILAKVLLLETFGPQLGRPHADTLKGGTAKNLKELRA
ncbi:type II toxin-antitoxin system RelE/ParE family toxin, partial [bacterium]|nr:type II toxin-antitoxin system RelE/ParE family toxin [bacterium]